MNFKKLQRKHVNWRKCPCCGNIYENEDRCPACDWSNQKDRLPLRPLSLQEIIAISEADKKERFLDRTQKIHWLNMSMGGAFFTACGGYEMAEPNTVTSNPKLVTCRKCQNSIKRVREAYMKLLAGEKAYVGLDFRLKQRELLAEFPTWGRNFFDENALSSLGAFCAVMLEESKIVARLESLGPLVKLPEPKGTPLIVEGERNYSDWMDYEKYNLDLDQIWGFELHYRGENSWHLVVHPKPGYHWGDNFEIGHGISVRQTVELLKNPKVKILKIVNYHSSDCFIKEVQQLFDYIKRDQQEAIIRQGR